jgi:hypothetical protein
VGIEEVIRDTTDEVITVEGLEQCPEDIFASERRAKEEEKLAETLVATHLTSKVQEHVQEVVQVIVADAEENLKYGIDPDKSTEPVTKIRASEEMVIAWLQHKKLLACMLSDMLRHVAGEELVLIRVEGGLIAVAERQSSVDVHACLTLRKSLGVEVVDHAIFESQEMPQFAVLGCFRRNEL